MSERRIVSETGGAKGQKDARFDLIESDALWDLALVCGVGAKKYDDDNWRKGYSWRLSFGALMRHLHAFWQGEDYDPESLLPHLAHAMWHCMVLHTFSKSENAHKYNRFDDRPAVQAEMVRKMVDACQDISPPVDTSVQAGHLTHPTQLFDRTY